jgi:hypothetical protein
MNTALCNSVPMKHRLLQQLQRLSCKTRTLAHQTNQYVFVAVENRNRGRQASRDARIKDAAARAPGHSTLDAHLVHAGRAPITVARP